MTAQVRRKQVRKVRESRRVVIPLVIIALASSGVLAFVLAPVDTGSASPSREDACTGCHDTIVETLLTVSGVPAEYTPGAVYTITIQVDDLNGANGENGFYMMSDAGVFSNPGANAEVNSDTTASTVDTRPRAESSWTVDWTAPLTGTVTIHVYAVSATDASTGISAPGDDDIVTASAGAPIPEFSMLLLPIVGSALVALGVARLSRKRKQ
jgi:hypothetical protein